MRDELRLCLVLSPFSFKDSGPLNLCQTLFPTVSCATLPAVLRDLAEACRNNCFRQGLNSMVPSMPLFLPSRSTSSDASLASLSAGTAASLGTLVPFHQVCLCSFLPTLREIFFALSTVSSDHRVRSDVSRMEILWCLALLSALS